MQFITRPLSHHFTCYILTQNSGGVKEHQAANMDQDINSQWAAMKERATMTRAVSCVTVPKITINIGSCHGDDNYTMVS